MGGVRVRNKVEVRRVGRRGGCLMFDVSMYGANKLKECVCRILRRSGVWCGVSTSQSKENIQKNRFCLKNE